MDNKIGLYILECKNGRYYIGSTNNIARRLNEHMVGHTTSTKNLLPVKVVFFQACDTLAEARSLELGLKRKKSRKILEKIIEDGRIRGL